MKAKKRNSEEAAIRKLDKGWSDAAQAKKLNRVKQYYAKNGSVVWPDMTAAHGRAAVLAHVIAGDLVRDALVAERAQEPIEEPGRVMLVDCPLNADLAQAGLDVFNEGQGPCQHADTLDQLHCLIQVDPIETGTRAARLSADCVTAHSFG